ncbi:MAG: hypothetical protein LBR32_02675, partial [Propionibacteriaceae bacterium]|nr:hypothetical protein [Propionibacteriaceae bacterium]
VAKAFDPAKNSWRDIAQPPSPYGTTRSWADGGLAVIGHQVYIASDYPGNTGSDCGEPYFISYDLDTDKWTELPLPAGELCAINYGGIYAVGDRIAVLASDWEDGNTKNGTQPDRVYDTKAKTWSDLPRDPVNVGGFNNQRRHAYVDGKQLVVVHFDDDESHSVIGAVSFLDPIGGTWSTPEETGITGVDKQREGWEYRCETVWSNGLITCFSVNSQQDPSTWPFYAFRLVSGTAKAKEVVAGQPSSPSSSFNFVEPGALLGLFAPTAGGRIMSITGQIISVPVYPGNYDYLHDPNNIIWAKPQDRGIGQGSILGHDRFMNGGKFYLFRYA